MNYKKLIEMALQYRKRAYCPYSNFKVGAAALFENEAAFGGCNIENASFGATNCSERTAIFKGISEGFISLRAIAIVGSLEEYTYPCGICRQVINEFATKDTIVIIARSVDDYIVMKFDEIFPGSFSKEDLIGNSKSSV